MGPSPTAVADTAVPTAAAALATGSYRARVLARPAPAAGNHGHAPGRLADPGWAAVAVRPALQAQGDLGLAARPADPVPAVVVDRAAGHALRLRRDRRLRQIAHLRSRLQRSVSSCSSWNSSSKCQLPLTTSEGSFCPIGVPQGPYLGGGSKPLPRRPIPLLCFWHRGVGAMTQSPALNVDRGLPATYRAATRSGGTLVGEGVLGIR